MSLSTVVNQTMCSVEIAELLESRHADVCRTIERLMAKGVIQGSAPTAYTHPQNGQRYQQYHVSKRDSYIVVAQLSPEFTARLVDRWQELENQARIPQNLPDALRLAADLAEEKQKLENQLAIAAPKVQFVDSYVTATGSLGFRETCKLLHIKEPTFRKFLIDSEIMYLLAGKLTPYAQHIDAGRFTVKTGENLTNGHAFIQNKFTPKGIQWIAGLLAAHQIKDIAA
ncbi:phage antirepressor KilAC domain-containing protein [Yersinia kristensenii]|uniref:phage antirepressor KilAC domain-containing protein n=1 Tax=Yersinia kristensenii TaxID=28152 RepID=UPI0005E48677|nr:DNA-binding protein [Yersinia kristensenii]CFR20091.1 phage regulatory protein [Yersinia kristensenii]